MQPCPACQSPKTFISGVEESAERIGVFYETERTCLSCGTKQTINSRAFLVLHGLPVYLLGPSASANPDHLI